MTPEELIRAIKLKKIEDSVDQTIRSTKLSDYEKKLKVMDWIYKIVNKEIEF